MKANQADFKISISALRRRDGGEMIKERGEEMERGKANLTEFSSIPLPD
jgi:hypothetical protein